MSWVEHLCKTCPTVLRYEQRTNRKLYCAPCKRRVDQQSKANSQRLRRQRFGRISIKLWRELEA